MAYPWLRRLDERLGIAASTGPEQELLRERLIAIKRQSPWLYGILFAIVSGLHASLSPEMDLSPVPTSIFLGIIILRMIYWLRLQDRPIPVAIIKRDLRRSFFIALIFCACVSAWTLHLFASAGSDTRLEILVFAGLAAIGCGYAVTCFPALAKVPLMLLTIPLAAATAIDGGQRRPDAA